MVWQLRQLKPDSQILEEKWSGKIEYCRSEIMPSWQDVWKNWYYSWWWHKERVESSVFMNSVSKVPEKWARWHARERWEGRSQKEEYFGNYPRVGGWGKIKFTAQCFPNWTSQGHRHHPQLSTGSWLEDLNQKYTCCKQNIAMASPIGLPKKEVNKRCLSKYKTKELNPGEWHQEVDKEPFTEI